MGLLYFVVLLGVIIFIHEFGHFVMAKLFHVYVGEFSLGMGPKLFSYQGKETLYYMGCYGIGVSRTVAALYEQNLIKDKNDTPCGFALPKAVAPYAIQIIPKVESEEKLGFAMDLYNKLQNAGINAIIDDREKVTMGAKIKDSKILGTPFITVIGDRQEGESISLEDAKTGETTSVTVEELINMLKSN